MVRATPTYKLALSALYCVVYSALYLYPNYFPSAVPVRLPLLTIDTAIPLVPWSFIVYLSDYVLAAIALVTIRDVGRFNAFARHAFGTLIVCGFFFAFFPTTYPRPEYPETSNALVAVAMWMVRSADTPNNCFPSMHVATTCMAAWSLRHHGARVTLAVTLWAVLIMASTMTTKQHYFVDILGGFAVVVAVIYFEHLLFARGVVRAWIGRAQSR